MLRLVVILAFVSILMGCATARYSPKRAAAAKVSFDRVTKEFHLPSAEATGTRKTELLTQSARGYEDLLRQFSDQHNWCAQALRSLGNVRVEQGKLDEAVRLYTRVGEKYPREEWEVLQAWKSAGDLLWQAKRPAEAKKFYAQIVKRFDAPEMPPIVKIVVNTSKKRLAEQAE